MKRIDVDAELKALRAPERGRDFWEAFPRRVLAELPAFPAAAPPERRASMPRLAWGFGVALACLVAAACVAQSRTPKTLYYGLLKDEEQLRQTVRQFPTHVRALMLDEHGLHKLIEDQP